MFKIGDDEIDVETVMEKIRENVRQRGMGGGKSSNEDTTGVSPPRAVRFASGIAHDHMNFLRLLKDPKPQGPIAAHGSAVIERAKRFIRRILAPYHRGIFARQAEFNANVVGLTAELIQALERSSNDHAAMLDGIQTRLDTLQAQQAAQAQQTAAQANRIAEQTQALIGLTTRLDTLHADQAAHARQSAEHANQIVEQTQALAGLTTRLEALHGQHERATAHSENQISELTHSLAGQRVLCEELSGKHIDLFQRYGELRQETILQKRRLDLILSELRKRVGDERKSLRKVASQRERLADHSYFLFENQYRLSREVIKTRQEIYLPVFKERAASSTGRETTIPSVILDIGCGRGEFLELLREHGIPAKGIDLNEDMVYFCQERGLAVEQANAFDYLQDQPDESLGGIIACQVIEHLQVEEMVEFIKLCCQKLRKGSKAVFETVNPLSLLVSATNFYLDLSHVRQIHPLALQFLAEAAGFVNTEVKFLSPYPDESKLQLLSGSDAAFQQINENFGRLNDILFGHQDYAVICEK